MEVLEILIGVLVTGGMALFTYVGLHVSKERQQGKSLPMFWEKKEKKMGYGKGYSKKPAKKAKMVKKPAKKKKVTKKY